jgi:hypothetical protein
MAITALYEGTATISVTEYSLTANSTTLATKTDVGAFQVLLDLNALAAGDQYELKIYETARTGDTKRLLEVFTFTGAQTKPIVVLPTILLMKGWDVTMKKLAGTDRAVIWSVRQVA